MKAIIILYQGQELTEAEIDKVVLSALTNNHEVHSVTLLRDNDVAQSIMKAVKTSEISEETKTVVRTVVTPEDNAVIFLGTMMESELKHFDPGVFIASLVKRVNEAKKQPSKRVNREFMNALFILSQEDLCISKEILDKYNFDSEKIKLVKETYNFVSRY